MFRKQVFSHRRFYPRAAVLLLLLWAALLRFMLALPPLEGTDEIAHFGYIAYVRQHSILPPLETDNPIVLQETGQPPLFYLVEAAWSLLEPDYDWHTWQGDILHNPWADFNKPAASLHNINQFMLGLNQIPDSASPGIERAILWLRFPALFMGLLTTACFIATARRLLNDSAALFAGMIFAFTMTLVYIFSYVTNDSLMTLAATAITYGCVRMMKPREPHPRPLPKFREGSATAEHVAASGRVAIPGRIAMRPYNVYLLTGVMVSVGILTKAGGLLFLPVMGVALVFSFQWSVFSGQFLVFGSKSAPVGHQDERDAPQSKKLSTQHLALSTFLLLAIPVLAAALWYGYMLLTYNDPFGMAAHLNRSWVRSEPIDVVTALPLNEFLSFRSFWGGMAGGYLIPANWIFIAPLGVLALAVYGGIRGIMHHAPTTTRADMTNHQGKTPPLTPPCLRGGEMPPLNSGEVGGGFTPQGDSPDPHPPAPSPNGEGGRVPRVSTGDAVGAHGNAPADMTPITHLGDPSGRPYRNGVLNALFTLHRAFFPYRIVIVLALICLAMLAAYARWMTQFYVLSGRLMLPGYAALILLVVMGLRHVPGFRWTKIAAAGWSLFVTLIYAGYVIYPQVYGVNLMPPEAVPPLQGMPVRYGDIEMMGYRITPERLTVDSVPQVELCWRSLKTDERLAVPYAFSFQIAGADDTIYYRRESYPGLGAYTFWQPGQAFCDRFEAHEENPLLPGRGYRVLVKLVNPVTGEALAPDEGIGETGMIAAPGETLPPDFKPIADLDGIYLLAVRPQRYDNRIEIFTHYGTGSNWQPRPVTVFFHVLAGDTLIAQIDKPLTEDYPAVLWGQNEMTGIETYTIPLPPEAGGRVLDVYMGIYNSGDGTRLTVTESQLPVTQDNRIFTGTLPHD